MKIATFRTHYQFCQPCSVPCKWAKSGTRRFKTVITLFDIYCWGLSILSTRLGIAVQFEGGLSNACLLLLLLGVWLQARLMFTISSARSTTSPYSDPVFIGYSSRTNLYSSLHNYGSKLIKQSIVRTNPPLKITTTTTNLRSFHSKPSLVWKRWQRLG